MQAKRELRKSERSGHKSIIKLEDDRTRTPYYAVSHNLSETGMYFKSIFELAPGTFVHIRVNDYVLSQNQIPAKVVWCKKIEDSDFFRYGVGVEFIQMGKSPALTPSFSITSRTKTPNTTAKIRASVSDP